MFEKVGLKLINMLEVIRTKQTRLHLMRLVQ